MNSFFNKIKKSIFFYTLIFIAVYYIGMMILDHFNLQYLLWVRYAFWIIVCVGIIAGTIQFFAVRGKDKPVNKRIRTLVLLTEILLAIFLLFAGWLFDDDQTFAEVDGKRMVKQTHSFYVSNWIRYYDYKGWFVCGKHERIHEMHDDSIGEYLYTIYYDEDGNVVGSKDMD